jgi:hypothetical protein
MNNLHEYLHAFLRVPRIYGKYFSERKMFLTNVAEKHEKHILHATKFFINLTVPENITQKQRKNQNC